MKGAKMEILHLSDLHIGNILLSPFINEKKETGFIVDDIIKQWKVGKKPLILFTGDIVNDGEKKEYETAKGLLSNLKTKGFEIMILPGNHDYGRIGNFADKANFEHFKTNFKDFFENGEVEFPYIRHFKDVTIIGLNSMQGEMEDEKELWANGQIGTNQLTELKEVLKAIRDVKGLDYKIVLALHHHPFDLENCDHPVHCLKDGKALMDIIALDRYKVDVLLFGHEHENYTKFNNFHIPLIHMNDKSTKKEGGFFGRTPKHPAYIIKVNSNEDPTAEPMIW
ncbi:MAG: metallophosphoesterase family protein [Planctomycetota bacterium]|jgi:3',5'-cyclic AMP phosphodiesterase CpdA